MKTFLKILGALAIFIVIVLVLALKRVDYSPYFYSDYYTTTKNRLDSLSSHLLLEKGNVKVGFSKESITPGLGAEKDDPVRGVFKKVPMAGFGSRKGKYAEGIHDSIFVKAVAFQVRREILVMVGSDLLIIPPVLSEGVSKKVFQDTGLGRDHIIFSATHTHSSVGAWSSGFVGKQFAGLPNPDIVAWLVQQFTEAIENAVQDMKPGKFGTGSFDAADFVSNRLIGKLGEINPAFVYLIAKQNAGKEAILGSFGAHPTTLGSWNMQISADYPGYWQRKLEKEGVDMAVFFAGSVGSQSARSKGKRFEEPKYIGEALADSVLKYAPMTKLHDSIALASMSLKMDLPAFQVRVTDGMRLRPVLSKRLFPSVGVAYLQGTRIGNLIWITSPCDFSGEMALSYRNAVCREGFDALVTSFNGSYVGYIIPGKYYHLNEYESRLMSWFGPYMGPYFDEMITRTIQRLTSL